jgi:uncharacterized membrane protein HdeD (DUF308 family)
MTKNWWAVLLRGILGVLFGVYALMLPMRALALLVFVYAFYALINGIISLAGAITGGTAVRSWWSLLAESLLSVAAGVVLLLWPGAGAVALVYVFAFWAVMSGMVELVSAVELRKEIEGEWLLGLAGVLSIAAGIFVAFRPVAGLFAITWIIGGYALAFGIVLIGLSFRLRSVHKKLNVQGRAEPPRPIAPQPA